MATTGALGNYYVDSFLLGADAADELGAGRYAPGALGQPPRQAAALAEHPDFSPCSFQSKAAVFGASWNPVHAAGANAVPAAVYHHHHHHPYVHPQAPVAAAAPDGRYMRSWLEPTPGALSFAGLPSSRPYGIKPEPLSARRGDCPTLDTHTLSLTDYACGSPPVDREKQSSEGAFSENNPENESGGDKPPIDPSKCLLPPDRPPPPRRPPGSAGPPAFSQACLRPLWEPPEQGPGARSQKPLFGTPRIGPQVQRAVTSGPAGLGGGEAAATERGGGAGAAGQAKTSRPFLRLPGTSTEILWAVSSKAARQRESFVRLDCPGAATATAAGTLGEKAKSLQFLPSASGGVNPAQDEAAGDRATRVPLPDYSNKVEK